MVAVDIGTSKIKAMLYEPQQNQTLLRTERSTSSCQVSGLPPGWHEVSPLKILDLTKETIAEIMAATPQDTEIAAITFTGAMHGILLVDMQGNPLTNLIDWRDRRVLDHSTQLEGSVLEHIVSNYGTQWASLNTGCQLANGYGVTTLYWLAVTNNLPQIPVYLGTIVDFVASHIAGESFITDYSLAASTGLFNIINQTWCRDFILEIGAKNIRLPEVVPANSAIGQWQNIAILAPAGDHTAAVYAVLGDDQEKAHINIGTGSQVVVYSSVPSFDSQLETRIGLTGDFLLVSAGAVGGHTLDSWIEMANNLFPDFTKRLSLNDLLVAAEHVPHKCGGLSLRPIFTGTRSEPSLRGNIEGISLTNFTVGHLTRACLEGIAREWNQALSVISEYTTQNYDMVSLTGRLATNSKMFRQIVEYELQSGVQVVSDSNVSMLGMAQHAQAKLSLT